MPTTSHPWKQTLEHQAKAWLNAPYFTFLRDQRLAHVFEQGYYMPHVIDINRRPGIMCL